VAVPFKAIILIFFGLHPSSLFAEQSRAFPPNFESEAAFATRQGVPHLVLFTANDCTYCDRLHTEVLKPGLEGENSTGQLHITEINIDRGGKVIDFDGAPVRGRIFVNRYQVIATPTAIFMTSNGTPLAKPVIGYRNKRTFLEALDKASPPTIIQAKDTFTPSPTTDQKL